MKRILLAGAVALFGFAARQATIPAVLSQDLRSLAAANSVTVDVVVRIIGSTPDAYQVSLAKPNLFKITGPDGFVVSDGHAIYHYEKSKNDWYQTPADDAALTEILMRPEVFGWAPVLQRDPVGAIAAARQGNSRVVAGNPATEVDVVTNIEGVHGTLFIDQRLGVPRGYLFTSDGKNYLALASNVTVGTQAANPSDFAFVPPDGAKKVDPPDPNRPSYTNVQSILTGNCMPCHNATSKSGGFDLTNYAGVTAAVTPSSSAQSRLYTVLQPGPNRMPIGGRPPLTNTQIQLIKKWIDAGAKNN